MRWQPPPACPPAAVIVLTGSELQADRATTLRIVAGPQWRLPDPRDPYGRDRDNGRRWHLQEQARCTSLALQSLLRMLFARSELLPGEDGAAHTQAEA